MLAEIHHKVSQSDRREDQLTGDFFGAIRYLPFEKGLKPVLGAVDLIDNRGKWLKTIDGLQGYIFEWEFWKREEEGEIDLFLSSRDVIIGIEVKYRSGLSSVDEEGGDALEYTESVNQLSRYSKMLEKLSDGRDANLLFLAPYETMSAVKQSKPDISPSVTIGFLCWEDILECLKGMDITGFEKGEQLIIQDLRALLSTKGLSRFYGFTGAIFNRSILTESYTFTGEDIGEMSWPKQIIRKDDTYVYHIG